MPTPDGCLGTEAEEVGRQQVYYLSQSEGEDLARRPCRLRDCPRHEGTQALRSLWAMELYFPSVMKKIPAAVMMEMHTVSTPRRPRKGLPRKQSFMELERVAVVRISMRLTKTLLLARMLVL